MRDVAIHPYPNFSIQTSVEVISLVNNYMPQFYMDVSFIHALK